MGWWTLKNSGKEEDSDVDLEHIATQIKEGYTSGQLNSGWWDLKIEKEGEIDDSDLEHIAGLIKEGYASGELNDESKNENIATCQNCGHNQRKRVNKPTKCSKCRKIL